MDEKTRYKIRIYWMTLRIRKDTVNWESIIRSHSMENLVLKSYGHDERNATE